MEVIRKKHKAYNRTLLKGELLLNRKVAETPELDRLLTNLYNCAEGLDESTEEYSKVIDQIEKVHKLKAEKQPKRVSPDTLAIIGANLAVTLIVISYEHANIIGSKVLGFLIKPKI